MIGHRHQKAYFCSDFYRHQFRRLLNALLVSIIIMVVLISVILYLVFFKPSLHYYAITTEGKTITIVPSK